MSLGTSFSERNLIANDQSILAQPPGRENFMRRFSRRMSVSDQHFIDQQNPSSGNQQHPGGSGDNAALLDDNEGEEEEVELTGCAGSCFCHPKAFCHRLIALAMMCFLGFGSYFCFDNPGALQREIKDTMDISTYEFANLYSWYSWPNVILPIIGGYLMDSVFGVRIGTIVFASFIIIGQVMFALVGMFHAYPLMEVGRFVFGIGGESLAVAQNTYAVAWFKGKELNMVFGFQLSMARLGSTVNFLVVGPLYAYLADYFPDNEALGWTLMLAGTTCILSFLCALILGVMDKRREKLLSSKIEVGEKIQWQDVLTFPPSFWLLSIVCLAYYVAIFPFISLGQVFFIKKFGFDAKNANFITGLIYLISAFASPLLGLLIDKTGRNVFYVFISIVATLAGHMTLAFTFWNPYIAVSIMGVAYSLLASSLWPIAALVIPESQLGTAYGLMQAIQNLGLALITMLSGLVVDRMGYLWLELFFIFWLAVALVATVFIWLIDLNGDQYLNMTVEQREEYELKVQEKLAAELAAKKSEDAGPAPPALRPRTTREIRYRYLSRVGAVLPPHLGHARLLANAEEDEERNGTVRNRQNRNAVVT